MLQRMVFVSVLTGALVVSSGSVWAADQERTQEQTQLQEQEQIFGSQLMTSQERAEYRDRIRAAKTAEEREKIRQEHHARMTERAKERGVILPDEPPEPGKGHMGPGEGMGPGDMGPGGGRNR
jgi:hypothetical protein